MAQSALTAIPSSCLLLQPRPVDAAARKIVDVLSGFRPHRISPIHGADARDVEQRRRDIAALHDAYVARATALLADLNENLPVNATIELAPFLDRLADLKGDLMGALTDAAEAVS
jgi:hypothetical protein